MLEYVAEIQHLWADLDHYDPLELSHSECVAAAKKWARAKESNEVSEGAQF